MYDRAPCYFYKFPFSRMVVGNSWHLLGSRRTILPLPEFVSDGSVVTMCHTWTCISLSPMLEVQEVGLKEKMAHPLDSVPPSA